MAVFIPKHLQTWQPPNHSHKLCQWCTRGKFNVRTMCIVIEGPMRWHFCSVECCDEWQQRRHDGDVLDWMCFGAGERKHVLDHVRHGNQTPATAAGRCFAGLRGDTRVSLSVPEDHQLPQA